MVIGKKKRGSEIAPEKMTTSNQSSLMAKPVADNFAIVSSFTNAVDVAIDGKGVFAWRLILNLKQLSL